MKRGYKLKLMETSSQSQRFLKLGQTQKEFENGPIHNGNILVQIVQSIPNTLYELNRKYNAVKLTFSFQYQK